MSKKDYYIIEKNIDKIRSGKPTNFLDPNELNKVISKLKGYEYKILSPYKECEKKIIYTKDYPKIKLLEIISYEKLSHREILGSLFSLNIEKEMFGDIIIYNNHYYFLIVSNILEIIKNDFKTVGNKKIKIKEVDVTTLENYERKYEKIEIIVSSNRIDTVISRLIGTNRENVKKMLMQDNVIVNYEPCHKQNYILKKDDIFSIRKHGKYKFFGTIKTTKKAHYIIKCYKYTEN